MSLGIGIMIAGGLVAVLGLLLLFNRSGTGMLILGIVLAAVGLGGVGVGYTMDQQREVTYTVVEITDVSVRDDNKQYRVTLKSESGTETWIYVNDNQLMNFPKDSQITMQKRELKTYKEQQ